MSKAESDWKTVSLLSAHADCPRDAACFYCQQYVEKLLKAYLTLKGIEAPRTHNLRRLIQLIEPDLPEMSAVIDESDRLTEHGVSSRYPDDWRAIEDEEMTQMIRLAEKFGAVLKARIGF